MTLEYPGRKLFSSDSSKNLQRRKTRQLQLKMAPKMLQNRKRLKMLLSRLSQRRTKKKRTKNWMGKKMTI